MKGREDELVSLFLLRLSPCSPAGFLLFFQGKDKDEVMGTMVLEIIRWFKGLGIMRLPQCEPVWTQSSSL